MDTQKKEMTTIQGNIKAVRQSTATCFARLREAEKYIEPCIQILSQEAQPMPNKQQVRDTLIKLQGFIQGGRSSIQSATNNLDTAVADLAPWAKPELEAAAKISGMVQHGLSLDGTKPSPEQAVDRQEHTISEMLKNESSTQKVVQEMDVRRDAAVAGNGLWPKN